MTDDEREQARRHFERWSENVTKHFEKAESRNIAMFMLDASDFKDINRNSAKFMLQIGYCVLHDMPIIVPVPIGVEIPKKLEAVADCILRYDPTEPHDLLVMIHRALVEMGIIEEQEDE